MEREIKFRGLNPNTKKWHYGYFMVFEKYPKVLDINYVHNDVDAETVGQYTGLKDKNLTPVYDGDILKWKDKIVLVKWESQACAFWMCWTKEKEGKKISYYEFINADSGYVNEKESMEYSNDNIEVIGNIHQNTELI